MKITKKKIADLTLCYCVAQLQLNGKRHFVVASEKEHPCLLFDAYGNQKGKIWDGPGGTMSIVPVPGMDGAFLATHRFYSPNNAKEASIVMCRCIDGSWEVHTVAELPFVHRFDILERNGAHYLLACCIRSDYEYKDDWRFPGKTLGCKLPDDPEQLWTSRLELQPIKESMLKNHGYCRHVKDGIMTGLVTSDEGVFRFVPPAGDGDGWTVEQLISDAASDAVMVDLDGDGKEELLIISPFHGDTIRIYKPDQNGFSLVYEHKKRLKFAHAICAAEICGKKAVILGHRKEDRDLLAISYDKGYRAELIDHDVGPANVIHFKRDGKDILVSANRETDEVAYYELTM